MLTCSRPWCSPWKRDISLWGHISSLNACNEITCRAKPTWRWSYTILHPGGNISVISSSEFKVLPQIFLEYVLCKGCTFSNLWWSGHDFSQFWRWILWFQESCITGLHRQRETPFHCQSHFGQLGRSFLTLALMLVRYISRLPKLVSYVIPCIVYSRNTAVPRWRFFKQINK